MSTNEPAKIPALGPFAKWTVYGAAGGLVMGFAFCAVENQANWRALRFVVGGLAGLFGVGGLMIGFWLDLTRSRTALDESPDPPTRPGLIPLLFRSALLGAAAGVVIAMTINQRQFGVIRPAQFSTLLYIVLAATALGLVGGWVIWRRSRRAVSQGNRSPMPRPNKDPDGLD